MKAELHVISSFYAALSPFHDTVSSTVILGLRDSLNDLYKHSHKYVQRFLPRLFYNLSV